MTTMRFNHMELTFPRGTLTPEFRAEVEAFYSGVFGWTVKDTPIMGQLGLLLLVDDGQFILLLENDEPMNRPRYDHLGLLVETRAEVDELLEACRRWQAGDDRVEIKVYDDLVGPSLTVHAFYVRFLLPIHFDVQCHEAADGRAPAYRWQYA